MRAEETNIQPQARARAARLVSWWRPALPCVLWLALAFSVSAEQRFPPPDFESGHQLPGTTTPAARALWLEYLDIAVLAGALGVATWLIYRKRSRKGLIGLSLFSLLYFGFWRSGCVCAIGSIQNVALALADPGYTVPLAAVAFFVLPVGLSLVAGRSFCSGVCPHGALQDLVLIKPLKVPAWLEHGLSVVPFIYLGAGVLFAVTGAAFLFCQYDPFVPLFRMNGRALMVLSGAALLVLGLFVGRPYCRFLCPLGALLKIGAVLAKFRVRVTPDYCTQCRLCQHTCPFGAMREPEAAPPHEVLRQDRKRLAWTLAALPMLVLLGAWLGTGFSVTASRMHPTVSLAERYAREGNQPPPTGTLSADDLALERARQAPKELLTEAQRIQKKFRVGTTLFGGWVGLVIAVKLLSLALRRPRTDFEPDRGSCVGCARCFEFCPNELVRRGVMPAEAISSASGARQNVPAAVPAAPVLRP